MLNFTLQQTNKKTKKKVSYDVLEWYDWYRWKLMLRHRVTLSHERLLGKFFLCVHSKWLQIENDINLSKKWKKNVCVLGNSLCIVSSVAFPLFRTLLSSDCYYLWQTSSIKTDFRDFDAKLTVVLIALDKFSIVK